MALRPAAVDISPPCSCVGSFLAISVVTQQAVSAGGKE